MTKLGLLFLRFFASHQLDSVGGGKKRSAEEERPNKHTDRAAWNAHFERKLSEKYDSFSFNLVSLEENSDMKSWGCKGLDIQEIHHEIALRTREIMGVEGKLINAALERISGGTFEADWTALELKRKQELVLEGLYRGACGAPRDNSRIVCPEMTISGLAGDETLHGTFDAYHAVAARRVIPAKCTDRIRTEERRQESRTFKTGFKKSGYSVDESQCNEEAAIALHACAVCKRTDKSRTAFKLCGNECQKEDWSDHKKFCGETRFDPAMFTPTLQGPEVFIGCPAPIEGFVRTPALWRQIRYLSESDSQTQDYHAKSAQLVFFVARRRAMASGSPAAVNMMYNIIKHMHSFGLVNLTLAQIQNQFETEYRVKFTKDGVVGAGPWAWPTQWEKDEEREFQRQRLAVATYTEEGARLYGAHAARGRGGAGVSGGPSVRSRVLCFNEVVRELVGMPLLSSKLHTRPYFLVFTPFDVQ
ncbi:hypothetical protein B0H16DRAFT_1454760 [Mycena metata]|uniref:MYND-type domain-containing protein n=1 Tax=Mycena metata TaxID=1033252 RepID=A0AAD7JJP3_9AGAR|nr:hypothetical protein B0H16DRAFT_1454760 [Mycena metata]